MIVYRVQDKSGRGPFRPGFSVQWADDFFASDMVALPTWMQEFGANLIDKDGTPGCHFGSAVLSLDAIDRWFSKTEQKKLRDLGFNIVCLKADRILAESKNQVVFERKRPLNKQIAIVAWPDAQPVTDADIARALEG